MNEEPNQEDPKIRLQADRTTALSLLDQAGGMNDFPVLKAFQEYIEAEQTRSRKRMLGLSVFFVVLLVVVVITFSVIITAVISRDQQNMSAIAARNQQLSDKLLDIALRDRQASQQPVVNVQPAVPQPLQQPVQQPPQESVLKPLLEKIENLTATISSKSQSDSARPLQSPSAESPETLRLREELRRQQEASDRIRLEREKIKNEQTQLQLEREKLRQAQVEQHRRRLYPEFYAREDARENTSEAERKPATEIKSVPEVRPDGAAKTAVTAKPVTEAKPVDLKTVKPISYFDEPEETPAKTPAPKTEMKTDAGSDAGEKKSGSPKKDETKNETKTKTLNVSSQESGSIPFLIELPENTK